MKTSSTSRTTFPSAGAFLLALLLAAAPALAAKTPREVVTGTSERVIAVLKRQDLSNAQKRAQIEDIVLESVDFETLARLTMARNWSRLTPAQQQQFLDEFRQHLSATYGRRIDDYRNETVDVTGERDEARGDKTVKTRINRGGGTADVLVDYRLRQENGEWKVIDIVIEGVSMVANFRSQFQDLMSQGGAERLLTVLREKTAVEEAKDGGG